MAPLRGGLEILHEDEHLLGVVKPAGIPTAHAAAGGDSLYARARATRPFVGVVSRLDLPVSGVVVFAKTSAAAAALAEQFRERTVTKEYSAVVEGRFPAPLGQWVEWIDRLPAVPAAAPRGRGRPPAEPDADGDADPGEPGTSREPGTLARMRARVVRRAGEVSLVELSPETGRKHQLRIQLASRGCPIVGDRRYGARLPFPEGIALHARRLAFSHPATGRPVALEVPLPASWRKRFPPLLPAG
ncbi:MAG: RluA family pseudouridine synthase [Planctomycetaceae bacterium]